MSLACAWATRLRLGVLVALLPCAMAHAKVVEYNWTISQTMQSLDGVPRMAYAINGRPGHETSVVVQSGDNVVVNVQNALDHPTALHWHGLHQNGTNEMDGAVGSTQCPIPPGHSFTYRFSTANHSGTYWFHAHHQTQYADGLRGPVIILDDPSVAAVHPPYDSDTTFELSDWYHTPTDILTSTFYLNGTANPTGMEPMFDSGLINGRGVYDCAKVSKLCIQQEPAVYQFDAGKTHRLRLVNTAAYAGFRFSVDAHRLKVIEVDGFAVEPYTVDAVELNVAQRFSVLVTADQPPSSYWIRAVMFHGPAWTVMSPSAGFNDTVLAHFKYAGSPPFLSSTSLPLDAPVVLRDTDLRPIPPQPAPSLTANSLHILFSFNFETRSADSFQKSYVYLSHHTSSFTTANVSTLAGPRPAFPNIDPAGTSFRALAGQPLERYQVVQVTLINRDPDTVSGAAANPLKRDVVTIDACPTTVREGAGRESALSTKRLGRCRFGYTIVRFVADNPGVWLFHCHIDWHIAAGLAMLFVASPADVVDRGVSSSLIDTCNNYNAWKDAAAAANDASLKSSTHQPLPAYTPPPPGDPPPSSDRDELRIVSPPELTEHDDGDADDDDHDADGPPSPRPCSASSPPTVASSTPPPSPPPSPSPRGAPASLLLRRGPGAEEAARWTTE
ncbi:Cupredoxin [Zopfochytrium polystomum]|nr:Cupredoxin [Zopfochytrium polystomum]